MVLRSNYVAFFHLIVIFHHSIAVHYDFMHIAPKELQLRKFSFGGRFIYLYVWNMFLQLLYFSMAFINDFIESKDMNSKHIARFKKFKDYIYTTLVFPVAFDVGVMFWIFYFINPDLVVSNEVHELVPEWFCHMLRTNIVIFAILEMSWTYRKYACYLCGLLGVTIFTLAYISWTLAVYVYTSEWVYPILEKFNWPQRIGFFGLNLFVPVTFFFIGDLLNNLLWKSKQKEDSLKLQKDKEQPPITDTTVRSTVLIRITEV
ncbi:hypothetical protein ACKWTF_015592 [Chironomus riparius]